MSEMRPTALYYCQHSVGLGHLVRSLAIAEALTVGFRVVVVSGGAIPRELSVPPDVELVALPTIEASDGRGSTLISLDPQLQLHDAWQLRREILVNLLKSLRPAALVIELFPFGRRKFARELIPLLEAARQLSPSPAVVSSVRDILVHGKANQQAHDDLAARRLNQYFDAVIVHADPRFATLDETFRPSIPLEPIVRYSGFVVRSADRPPTHHARERHVLVSAGGGRTGEVLFRAAVSAHLKHLVHQGIFTRLVTGPFLAPTIAADLETQAADCDSLVISRFEPQLCEAMASVSVSVSQCGYNTALDIIRAGVPALVVPYDVDGETEQATRASRLSQRGVVHSLSMSNVTPETLSAAIIRTLSRTSSRATFDLNGSEATARIVVELVDQRTRCTVETE